MTRSGKGNLFQNKCVEIINTLFPGTAIHNQKAVAKTIITPRGPMWVSQRNDILGCIDIVAINQMEPPLFIQCTLHTGLGVKLKALATVPWPLEHCSVQVWQGKPENKVYVFKYGLDNDGPKLTLSRLSYEKKRGVGWVISLAENSPRILRLRQPKQTSPSQSPDIS